VLFLFVAEVLVCGRVGRDGVAIRGMDIAAETIGIRPLRPKLLARFRDRPLVLDVNAKGVLRAAALTTLKLPLSHCIFRPMAISERFGRWRRHNFEESFRCRPAAETAMGDRRYNSWL
jgi:hypothetical protein